MGVFLDSGTDAEIAGEAEELSGHMGSDPDEERLAHSVLENDEQMVKDGQMLAQSVDYALSSFTPDLMFEKIVSSYRDAQRLFGPTLIRELTGFEPGYIEKNLKIREFQEQLKRNLQNSIGRMRKEGLLDEEGRVTDDGMQLAALAMYTEELDHLRTRGLGGRESRERAHYGDPKQKVPFRHHRYRDLDVKASITKAIKRGHATINDDDLVAVERVGHGRIAIIYALDASGSMRGPKIHVGKKAGIALAYKAIQDRNDTGLLVFTSEPTASVAPTQEFPHLLHELVRTRAGSETDLSVAIRESVRLFPKSARTKHLVLITDAIPTRGAAPGKAALEATSEARDAGVTISLVGINLEDEGEKLAKEIVALGEGKLYRVTDLDALDTIVLEDYERVRG